MTIEDKIDAIIDKYFPKIEFWVRYANRCALDVTFYFMKKFADEVKKRGD